MITSPIPISSPTSTPIPLLQVKMHITHTFTLSIYHYFIIYLFSTLCCFIYILVYGDKSISFLKKFFSSFIAPFVFLTIFIKNALIFILSTIFNILITFLIHIVIPILNILYTYFVVPFIELIAYIHRHTKIIWTILAKGAKTVGNIILDIIDFLIRKIISPVFGFIYRYLIYTPIKFIIDYIIKPLLNNIIIPVCKYISSIRAFQIIADFIARFFIRIYHILSDIILAIAKVCESIIDAAGEIIKESYEQIIYPFVQLVKRLFGE